jgi:hypothetical protein
VRVAGRVARRAASAFTVIDCRGLECEPVELGLSRPEKARRKRSLQGTDTGTLYVALIDSLPLLVQTALPAAARSGSESRAWWRPAQISWARPARRFCLVSSNRACGTLSVCMRHAALSGTALKCLLLGGDEFSRTRTVVRTRAERRISTGHAVVSLSAGRRAFAVVLIQVPNLKPK